MSSPYPPGTKRGAEETLAAIDRTVRWASRIDTKNDVSDLDIDLDAVTDELHNAEKQLRKRYKIKTTELAIENFVYNQHEKVELILCGDLDERVSALGELEDYIADDFGNERPISLSKEELTWLVAQEIEYHVGTVDEYSQPPISEVSLDEKGTCPEKWSSESFPIYNRNY